jgi:hypothetical protein
MTSLLNVENAFEFSCQKAPQEDEQAQASKAAEA